MERYNIILYADNDSKRQKGLMFTDPLEKDECALFVFPKSGDHTFWNKNVSYPLTLIFCDNDNKVIAIKDMEADSIKPCGANGNTKYVIEGIKGAFEDVEEGNMLIIDNNGEQLYFV